jgi:hypothetical protein
MGWPNRGKSESKINPEPWFGGSQKKYVSTSNLRVLYSADLVSAAFRMPHDTVVLDAQKERELILFRPILIA